MFGKHIKQLRLENGLSQAQMAKKLGVTQGAISQWEGGHTRPDAEQLIQMPKLFQVPLDYFANERPEKDLDGVVEMRRRAIPVVGEIACGEAIPAEENIDGWIDLPNGIAADFALICKGDSMAPTFLDKDYVLIRKQPDVDDGRIAAVMMDDGFGKCLATLKRVRHIPDGLILIADNGAVFPPLVLRGEEAANVKILGAAIGYTRMI